MPYKFIPKTTILNNLSAFVPASKNQQFFYSRIDHVVRHITSANSFFCASTKVNCFAVYLPENYRASNEFSVKNFRSPCDRRPSRPEFLEEAAGGLATDQGPTLHAERGCPHESALCWSERTGGTRFALFGFVFL
jgi:hypothetical protein